MSGAVPKEPTPDPDLARDEQARVAIRAFLKRADLALVGPLWEMGKDAFTFKTRMVEQDGQWSFSGFEVPHLDIRELKIAAIDLRVFFLQGEPTYLPAVMKAVNRLSPQIAREGIKPLTDAVRRLVKGNTLRGALMYSGVVAPDDELDPADPQRGLLGDDQIVMDWINGIAFHQDLEAAARLEKQVDQNLVEHAVMMQLAQLMDMVAKMRNQIRIGLDQGWLRMQAPEKAH